MSRLTHRLVVALVAPTVLCVATTAAVAASALAPAGVAYASAQTSLVSLLNGARASAGLPALTVSSDLAAVAARQAGTMASTRVLAHTPNLPGAVCCWSSVGENVGMGASASTVHQAFMASSAHRANILSATYTQVGVGTAVDSSGMLWVSEIFRRPSGAAPPPPTTAPPTTARRTTAPPQPAPTTHPVAKPAPTRTAAAKTATTKAAVTPPPQSPAAPPQPPRSVRQATSRDLAAGRPPLGAASLFAAQLAGSAAFVNSSDPVGRVFEFIAVSARVTG